jgi:hypothetical protein
MSESRRRKIWRITLEMANALVGVGTLLVAIAAYLVASDTSDIKSAVGNISALATQTKRQADETHNQVVAVQGQADILKRQLTAMERLADASQGQVSEMRAEQRPQVAIEGTGAIQPLNFHADGSAMLGMEFQLKNLGHTIAGVVTVYGALYARSDNNVEEVRRKACATHDKSPTGSQWQGFNIMQGEEISVKHFFKMSASDVTKWKTPGHFGVSGLSAIPMVVGCVDYMFDDRHHQTPFVYEMDRSGAGPQGFVSINPKDGDVPANQLMFLIPPWFVSRPN